MRTARSNRDHRPAPAAPVVPLVPSAERNALREQVAELAAAYGAEYFVACAREGRAADELWFELAGLGLLGVNLPTEYGGRGAGLSELTVVAEELAAAGCPLQPLIYSQSIGGSILAAWGSEAQKEEWLPGLAAGTRKLSFAITEAGAGSNSQSLSLAASPEAGGFVLGGEKTFVSGLEGADAILVAARTGADPATGKGLLSLFLVDARSPGISRSPLPIAMVAPDKQWTVTFDRVRVPSDSLVGGLDRGFRVLFDGLNPERVLSAAFALGLGRYALDRATAYVRSRRVWQVPIGAHQGVAHPLAQGKVELESARLHTERAACLVDAGHPAGEAANMAKLVAADAAVHCLDAAIQVHGGHGLALATGLTDMWWMARALQLAPVSREMVLNYVAEHSLGLPKSY